MPTPATRGFKLIFFVFGDWRGKLKWIIQKIRSSPGQIWNGCLSKHIIALERLAEGQVRDKRTLWAKNLKHPFRCNAFSTVIQDNHIKHDLLAVFCSSHYGNMVVFGYSWFHICFHASLDCNTFSLTWLLSLQIPITRCATWIECPSMQFARTLQYHHP